MKRLIRMLILGTSLGLVASLSAEEPHLEFIRALRARQYNDLAMEYLQKISQNPSPQLARELPLEWARVRMDLARQEQDLGRRLALYGQARKDLEESIKKNPAQEGEARLEIAQVTVLQGKALLTQAEREENAAVRKAQMTQARGTLVEAGKQMEAATVRINAQIEKLGDGKTPKEKADKRALEAAKLRAEFDRGLNLFDQALTYVDEGNLKVVQERTDMILQAEKVLKTVADFDPKNPLCWLAHAWVGRCYHESGDPRKARTRYENIMAETGPETEAGKRLAGYFRILVLPEAVQGKESPAEAQRLAAEQWRTRYATSLNTPEGTAVTFRLAEIYHQQAEAAKDPKSKAPYLDQARRLYQQLEQTDNDYTDRARDRKIRITFAAQGGPTGDVTKFLTFDDCLVRAQYEVYKITTDDPKEIKDPKERDKKRQERYVTIIAALNRGLKLAEASKTVKVPERELLNASALLAYTHLSAEDYPNAVKAAETIVYGKPKTSQASTAAIYALQAYTQLVSDPARGEDFRDGMKKLVAFVKENWPDEPVADYARHQVGLLLLREKKLIEGMAELAEIKATYPAIIQVKWQLAAAATQADQDKLQPAGKDQRPFKDQAQAALESMPDLPANADPTSAHIYLSAKIQIGQQLYEKKKFKEMEAMVQPLLDRLPKMNLEDENIREQLRIGLSSLTLYARYGMAEADYSAGKYTEVRKVLDPVVERAKGGKSTELKAIPQLRFALLGLALRANVLDNEMKRAQEVLQVLQEYTDAKEGTAKVEAILQPIIKMMSDQIEEQRRKGQKAQLDRTVKSFSQFLDLLKSQQKKPSIEFLFVMGQSYVSLGRYADAVTMLEQVKVTADADERLARIYRAARLLLIRALRQSGELEKAEAAHKAVMAEDWGKQNLEALKEEGHLLEARDKYGPAAQHWNSLLKTLQGRIQTDANAKEQYFEVYYFLVRSYYRFGQGQTDAFKKDKYIKASGGFIVKLESAWPDLGGEVAKARFTELMDREPSLKKAYEQAKAENK